MSWHSWPEHPVSKRDYQATTGRQADGVPRHLGLLMDKKLHFPLESWVRQKEHYFLSTETSFYRWENGKANCGVLEKDFLLYLRWLSGMFWDLSCHFDPRENRLEDKQRCPEWTLRWVIWSVLAFERHSTRAQEECGMGKHLGPTLSQGHWGTALPLQGLCILLKPFNKGGRRYSQLGFTFTGCIPFWLLATMLK